MNDTILIAEKLNKRKGSAVLLNDFSLTLKRGKVYGLIGVRGSGKTSLLRALVGLTHLDSGSISWKFDRKSVGAMIGEPAYHRELTIRGSLEAQSLLLGIKPDNDRIDMLMERLRITQREIGNRSMRHLLLGQPQRTGIAMAMIGKPELLLLDEPHISLDIEWRDAFDSLFLEEVAGKTAIVTAQSAEQLKGIATDFIAIDGGANATL
jgi:ABC-2 type transport system ATP-binding protein